jgi:hypothetical protein
VGANSKQPWTNVAAGAPRANKKPATAAPGTRPAGTAGRSAPGCRRS